MQSIILTILPQNAEVVLPANISLAEALQKLKIPFLFPCAGGGTCGKCRVRFLKGVPPAQFQESVLLTAEELQNGTRLACMTRLLSDCTVQLPEESLVGQQAVQPEQRQQKVKIDPPVEKHFFSENLSTFENYEAWVRFLRTKLPTLPLDFLPELTQKWALARQEKTSGFTVALFGPTVLDVEAGDTVWQNFALAVDLGTTTVGVLLLHLPSGQSLDYAVFQNPQQAHGADLISRIAFCQQKPENTLRLQKLIVDQFNEIVQQFCLQHQISPSHLYLTVLAGNSVMTHLWWGVNPRSLGVFPFKPEIKDLKIDFEFPEKISKTILTFPLIDRFVGGDAVADLLTVTAAGGNEPYLVIDIGTNCEVMLFSGDRKLATSAPAGPALEGAKIKHGMRAVPGALTDLYFEDEILKWRTVDDQPPIGICGSGLFHIIHFLLQQGVVAEDGTIQRQNLPSFWEKRVKEDREGTPYILLVSPAEGAQRTIHLTQKDIREFQLANSAIRTAWKLLCKKLQLPVEDLQNVFIAGAFGNYIRPRTLLYLGTIPDVPLKRIRFLGNAALEGVRLSILNKDFLEKARQLASEVEMVELADDPDFQDVFVANFSLKTEK